MSRGKRVRSAERAAFSKRVERMREEYIERQAERALEGDQRREAEGQLGLQSRPLPKATAMEEIREYQEKQKPILDELNRATLEYLRKSLETPFVIFKSRSLGPSTLIQSPFMYMSEIQNRPEPETEKPEEPSPLLPTRRRIDL